MSLKKQVSGDGPLGGVCIVGEAPNAEDLKRGKPFISKSGQILRRYATIAGHKDVRYENVIERKLVDNDISPLYLDKENNLPGPELREWYADLAQRLEAIKPTAIVACGRVAMQALTLYGSMSVHSYVLRLKPELQRRLGNIPVVAAFHPTDILRQPNNAFWLRFALGKVHDVLSGASDPEMEMIVSNNIEDAIAAIRILIEDSRHRPIESSIDIETGRNHTRLTAIGFSAGPDKAYSLSCVGDDKCSPEEWDALMEEFRYFLGSTRILKIGQNFNYDAQCLWYEYGMETKGPVWDTMHAHNILYSELKNSLEEQGRLYFYSAPWKGGWKNTGRDLREYNAVDVINQHRIKDFQVAKLKERGLYDYFTKHHHLLWEPAFKLSIRGLNIDLEEREKIREGLHNVLDKPRIAVEEFAQPYLPPGERKKKKRNNAADTAVADQTYDPKIKRADLVEALIETGIPEKETKEYYVAKAADQKKYSHTPGQLYKKAYRTEIEHYSRSFNVKSPAQVAAVFTNAGIKLPKVKQQHTKQWATSTNEKALRTILEREKRPEIIEFAQNMLLLRAGNKLHDSYLEASLDEDGRWRCSFNVEGTDTGRSASRQSVRKTGGNVQNFPRDDFYDLKFKNAVVADPGFELATADQQAAEARIVAYLAECEKLIHILESGEDAHLHTLAICEGTTYEALLAEKETDPKSIKKRRQEKKPVGHGANYNMGPVTLAETMLMGGTPVSPDRAGELLELYHGGYPEIRSNFHAYIVEQITKNRKLINPFGREHIYLGRIDTNTHREGFAYIPQSTVPHITKMVWLFLENHNFFKEGKAQMLQEGHDSLLWQVRPKYMRQLMSDFMEYANSIEFKIKGKTRSIPWDAEVGGRWGEMEEYDV